MAGTRSTLQPTPLGPSQDPSSVAILLSPAAARLLRTLLEQSVCQRGWVALMEAGSPADGDTLPRQVDSLLSELEQHRLCVRSFHNRLVLLTDLGHRLALQLGTETAPDLRVV